MIETDRKIKVISQSDQERNRIDAEIRRHEVALLRALRDLNRRFPSASVVVIDALAHKISLTKENG